MCFNKEVSLLMFILGLSTSIKLYTDKNDKDNVLATVILGISIMQLIEYFIFLNHNKSKTNLILSALIHVVILLHVITFVAMCIDYSMLNNQFYIPVIIFTCLFIFFFIATTLTTNWNNAYSLKNGCRLSWGPYKDPNNKYFAYGMGLSYVIIFFMLFYVLLGYKGLAIIIPTFLFSYLFSIIYDKNGTMGSYWCFLVLVLCIFAGIFDII